MGSGRPEGEQDFSATPRIGQFPGEDLRLGQRDQNTTRQREEMV